MSNLGPGRHHWPESIKVDFIDLFLGKYLGGGTAREVYTYQLDETKVLKIEYASASFQNAREWQIWHDLKDAKDYAQWLAPCHWISPCGMVLIQSRTLPAREKDLHDRMPAFITDMKRANYGMLNGRLVCHDYGTAISEYRKAERRADWWG